MYKTKRDRFFTPWIKLELYRHAIKRGIYRPNPTLFSSYSIFNPNNPSNECSIFQFTCMLHAYDMQIEYSCNVLHMNNLLLDLVFAQTVLARNNDNFDEIILLWRKPYVNAYEHPRKFFFCKSTDRLWTTVQEPMSRAHLVQCTMYMQHMIDAIDIWAKVFWLIRWIWMVATREFNTISKYCAYG